MTDTNQKPIYAGRCLINTEAVMTAGKVQKHRTPYAGVRIMQSSSGGGDEHYTPPSDVYLYLEAKDAQAIAAYFSKLARLIREVEA
jgi:hypothetical protein